jgi:hypothetical protein
MNRKRDIDKLRLKKETLRVLQPRVLSDLQLAQVAGGTWKPTFTACCGR